MGSPSWALWLGSPADLLPCFLQYLDRIGQLFFGVPPKQTSSYGGLLGELCGLVLDRWLPSVLSNLLLKSVPLQFRLSTEHHLMGLNSKYEHLPTKAGQGQCSVVLWAFYVSTFLFMVLDGDSGRSCTHETSFSPLTCISSPSVFMF